MGELMLCPACENFRYPMQAASKTASKASVSISTKDTPLTTIPTMAASKTTVPPSVKDSSLTSTQNLTRNNSTQCDNSVQCELLFFMNSTVGKRPDGIIRQTILDFYRDDEIMNAKQLLVSATDGIDGLNIQAYTKNRIGCNKVKLTVDDIMNIYKMIDENCYRENMPSSCAVQNTRIPVLTADLSDNTDILLEINRLRQQVE